MVWLDRAFFVLHAALIAFNMTGWIWRRTRPWHLLTLAVTTLSWFVLGARYGWGYCLCTDWHFQVRRGLGYRDRTTSYIELLFTEVFGWDIGRTAADWLAGSVYLAIVGVTAFVWLRPTGRDLSRNGRDSRG